MTKKEKVEIFLDSGAPSLYNKFVRKPVSYIISKSTGRPKDMSRQKGSYMQDRKDDDYSFMETENYTGFFKEYMQFIAERENKLGVYANLDIINNAERTWANQQAMEKKGLSPIPVFHMGEDLKWLKKLVDNYGHIAIGGVTPNRPAAIRPSLDRIFTDLICDGSKRPRLRVHGFGVTAPELVYNYPWYSVDSTRWLLEASYGRVLLWLGDGPEHTHRIVASRESSSDARRLGFVDDLSKDHRRIVFRALERIGIKLSENKDICLHDRTVANVKFYQDAIAWVNSRDTMGKFKRRYPFRVYLAQSRVGVDDKSRSLDECKYLYRLVSFFYFRKNATKHFDSWMEVLKEVYR